MFKPIDPELWKDPAAVFGGIDVYLIDQLLKRRIRPDARILDAGCGGGRNLEYFLRTGHDVSGIDESEDAIERVRQLARQVTPKPAAAVDPEGGMERFRVELIEEASFAPRSFDLIICNAVLHFARDEAHFESMLERLWLLLRPGGMFFSRLASSIGIEGRVRHLGHQRYLLPDGSERFLVDEARLLHWAEAHGAQLLEPIKTTNVQGLRCMTTWVMGKPAEDPRS